jgi:hypothetical protein
VVQVALLLTLDCDSRHRDRHPSKDDENGCGHKELDEGEPTVVGMTADHLSGERSGNGKLHK